MVHIKSKDLLQTTVSDVQLIEKLIKKIKLKNASPHQNNLFRKKNKNKKPPHLLTSKRKVHEKLFI